MDITTFSAKTSMPDYFATTHWTMVSTASQWESPEGQGALEALCRKYWYPLYVFTRRQGESHADAEDLVQGFFCSFLKKNHLLSLRKQCGRFRAYLLACLKHYLANERDKTRRKKRGGSCPHLSIDWSIADEKYHAELADATATPDRCFDQAWINTLLERVLTQLGEEKQATGQALLFATLKPFLVSSYGIASYERAAATLGMSQGAVRVATNRLRRRYQELLRAEIGSTCPTAHLEQEIQLLLQVFSD